MKIESIIVLIKTDDDNVRQVALSESDRENIINFLGLINNGRIKVHE